MFRPSEEAEAALDALQNTNCDDWMVTHKAHIDELECCGLIYWSRNREGYAISHRGMDHLRGDP